MAVLAIQIFALAVLATTVGLRMAGVGDVPAAPRGEGDGRGGDGGGEAGLRPGLAAFGTGLLGCSLCSAERPALRSCILCSNSSMLPTCMGEQGSMED